MKTISLQGKIKFKYDDYCEQIFLLQEDGLIINLISSASEIRDSFKKKMIQVCYYTGTNYSTRENLIENYVATVMGIDIESGVNDNGFAGSELTGYCESWESELTIGGHDLMKELKSFEGKFLVIDFNIQES